MKQFRRQSAFGCFISQIGVAMYTVSVEIQREAARAREFSSQYRDN